MSESPVQDLSGVTETLLIPLSIRALESQRPDAIIVDERAMAVVQQLDYDPTPVLAEGVFMYLEEAPVKSLVLTLLDRFPGAELVFDAFSPFFVRAASLRVSSYLEPRNAL